MPFKFPSLDLILILKLRLRPVAADSDLLALVYPYVDSDALSLPDVNLCDSDCDVDIAGL